MIRPDNRFLGLLNIGRNAPLIPFLLAADYRKRQAGNVDSVNFMSVSSRLQRRRSLGRGQSAPCGGPDALITPMCFTVLPLLLKTDNV